MIKDQANGLTMTKEIEVLGNNQLEVGLTKKAVMHESI